MPLANCKNKKTILFCGLCCLVYFVSYITRINYAATVSEVILSLGLDKQLASLAITGSFITYGAGQIISGIVGDYVKPRTMIFIGLIATSVCNVFMSFLSDPYVMTVVWCVNGLTQSMLWPPLTRIMAENLSPVAYSKACVAVTASSSVATILIYLVIVPLSITFVNWRFVFIISAASAILIAFVWFLSVNRLIEKSSLIIETNKKTLEKSAMSIKTIIFRYGLIPIMIIIVLQGILRDGITTWMPSYIDDVFHLGTSISILSTAVIPIFCIFSVAIASTIHRFAKTEVKASTLIWLVSLVSTFILIFVHSSQVIVSILLMSIITGCMYGINLMLICVLPARFKETGRVSTVSGMLNAFTYVGSAIASYGIAALCDNFGWSVTITSWFVVALLGSILSFICIKNKHLNRPY